MEHIYLDYAATTPVDPAVRRAMLPYLGGAFGNPSSLHSFGQEAQAAVDHARETVARLLGVMFRNIVFTGSATEANNLALRGVVRAAQFVSRGAGHSSAPAAEADLRSRRADAFGDQAQRASESRRSKQTVPPNRDIIIRPKLIVSSVEHESVLETAREMERAGEAEAVILPVDKDGIVDLGALKRSLDERTALVSVQYVNNETGTVQPIAEISKMIRNFREDKGKRKKEKGNDTPSFFSYPFSYPLLHTDAVQAFNWLDCSLPALGVDLLTLSAHKCYGPKGVGVLAFRQPEEKEQEKKEKRAPSPPPFSFSFCPILTGGGQEFGMRSGTQNVAGIAGCAAALALAAVRRPAETEQVGKLGELFFAELVKKVPGVELNGPLIQRRRLWNPRGVASAAVRSHAPHILNLALPKGCTLELVVALDQQGVAVSTGSACASRAPSPSHVLRAMGVSDERIRRSLRVSFGRTTTAREVCEAARRIEEVLKIQVE